ncbi:MAG: hypothetical protein JW876_05910 [Candidatus Krumholzibacteriota bacterium]|nr:hypothetical protein [Candidatus Krumholzibacteriota bacterium]
MSRLIEPPAVEIGTPDQPPLVFELVETPEDAIRRRPDEAHLLSDKNAVARDERPSNEDDGVPYSEGLTEHRVFAGGANAESPPAEDGQARRPAEPGARTDPAPEEGIDPAAEHIPAERRDHGPASDRDYLVQAHREFLAAHGQYIDDASYDQRVLGAGEMGGISLNTYAWDYASYILDMKRRLRENVHPPGAFTYLGLISGDTVIRFRVMPDGSVADIEVIGFNGHRSLMETSVTAVELSSPFRPLPADFPEDYLELMWTFSYLVRR